MFATNSRSGHVPGRRRRTVSIFTVLGRVFFGLFYRWYIAREACRRSRYLHVGSQFGLVQGRYDLFAQQLDGAHHVLMGHMPLIPVDV